MDKTFHSCMVLLCGNSLRRNPEKLFISVPSKLEIRNKWLEISGRNVKELSSKSHLYICEDHFNLPNDMENYIQYKIMGSVKRVRMKPGCFPSKFECQQFPKSTPRTEGIGQVEGKINHKNSNAALQIDAVKNEPNENDIFKKCGIYWNSPSHEMDYVNHDHNYAIHSCPECGQEQIEEQLEAKNLKPKDLGHSTIFESLSTSICNAVQIKNEDIDISYKDIKREIDEEKSREHGRICEMCYKSVREETDFTSTSYRSECTCQKQNDVGHSTIFENLLSTPNVLRIKNEDIDIFYEDIKHETGEEKSSECINLGEVCYKSSGKETDFSTSYISKSSCQKQNESLSNTCGEDTTLDKKTSFLDLITDSRLKPLEIKEETKEQDSSVITRRPSVPPMENGNNMEPKLCSDPLGTNLPLVETKNQCSSFSKSFTQCITLKVDQDHTGENVFECQTCSKTFTNSSLLRVHERIHTGKKQFHSKILKVFTNSSHSKVNERLHSEQKSFDCQTCSKSFSQMSSLTVHERNHKRKRPYSCKICLNTFLHPSYLRRHERIHTGEKPYRCKICSKSFSRKGTLKDHERSHTGEKVIHCKICVETFTTSSQLKDHRRIHTGEKSFRCKGCSKNFATSSKLKEHGRIHTGDKPFNCKFCSKPFSRMGTLRRHERIHTGEKPFNCKFCSRAFSRLGTLRRHERIHTGEKLFHCKICSKTFLHSNYLKVHGRVHTGEKPFHCKVCSKTFSNSSYLKIHGRIHTGEKPFHCKVCSKTFSNSSYLKVHGRIHSGEKPYHCTICSKSFRQMGSLNIHVRSHTGKNHFIANVVP